jgi:hypothetical protein
MSQLSGTSALAAGATAPTGFVDQYGAQHFDFVDSNQHIQDIVYNGTTVAPAIDATAATAGAVTVGTGTGLGSFSTAYDRHWIFLGANSHLYQIIYNPGAAALGQVDMTVLADTPPPPPPPMITSLSLTQGPALMGVQITGSGFGATPGSVTLGGTPLTLVAGTWAAGTITVQIPVGAATGNVVVTAAQAAGGQASNGVPFTVTASFGCP